MRVKYKSATERAYEVLLLNQTISVPINPKDIKLENIIIKIFSMQEWSKINNIPIYELTCKGKCNDGYTQFYKKGNKQYAFIFYNEDNVTERQRFTIAHEIGHIALGHKDLNNIANEKEADTFASQLLLPHCILEKLVKCGKSVTESYLLNTFGLSKQACNISLQNVGKKIDKQAATEYEDIILEMFKNFIDNETKNTKYKYYEEDEDLEKERSTWY
jgi:Predicted Zn peptidase